MLFLFFTILGIVIYAFTSRLVLHSLLDWLRVGASFVRGDPYVGRSLWFLTCLSVVKFLFWVWNRRRSSIRWDVVLFIVSLALGSVFGNCIHPKILLGGP